MKRLITLAAGLSMIAGIATAQTNVISQNAVGYVKVTVPANGALVLVRDDFVNLDLSPRTIAGIVGDQLGPGASAFTWDRGSQTFCSSCPSIDFLGNWNNDAEVQRGDAFWLVNAPTGPDSDVFILGEVPGANNGSDETTVPTASGFVGYAYPAAIDWTSTTLAAALENGSSMAQWDASIQNFVNPQSQKDFLGNWNTNPTLQPGEGFFITVQGTVPDWTETKPYAYP